MYFGDDSLKPSIHHHSNDLTIRGVIILFIWTCRVPSSTVPLGRYLEGTQLLQIIPKRYGIAGSLGPNYSHDSYIPYHHMHLIDIPQKTKLTICQIIHFSICSFPIIHHFFGIV